MNDATMQGMTHMILQKKDLLLAFVSHIQMSKQFPQYSLCEVYFPAHLIDFAF